MQKTFKNSKGQTIVVKVEKKRYYVQHSDMGRKFVLADDMLSLKLTNEEKDGIMKAIEELS